MRRTLKQILIIAVIVFFIGCCLFGLWADSQYESTKATIVTTYTTSGLLGGNSWTVYDTPRGRIKKPGIWGTPGEKMIIQVKKYRGTQ